VSTREPSVSLRALCLLFLRIGLSFGAGTGMSAVLQDELVRKRRAIARTDFMALFGLARLVPSGSMTALAVAIGYRYRGLPGTVVVLVSMILPSFVLTLLLTIAYTALSSTAGFRILNLTLMPAALAIVIVSAFGLAREYLRPSVELVLIVAGAAAVLVFGLNPSLVLLAGGAVGALAIRDRPEGSA
jgi:chromate transport protein ChrA